MAPYKPLRAPTSERPPMDNVELSTVLRDQFPASTLLLLGAGLLSTALLLTRSHWVVLPVFVALAYKLGDTLLQVYGWRENAYMRGVVPQTYAAQLPPVEGDEGPGASGVVVFILAARVNHPLGLLGAPGASELSGWAQKCYQAVQDNYDEYGVLGMSTYLGTSRAAGNEFLTIMYFRNAEGVYKFALSDIHKQTWRWFSSVQKTHPHLSVMHETYDVPPRHWEAVYVKMHRMGLAGASVKVTREERDMLDAPAGKEEGDSVWWSTPVDPSKGKMRSGMGRLDRGDGGEHVREGLGKEE
ncbi:hypothetical protein CALCODRAFT_492671 [Calocera cornea HHB12733]|uniref:Uncharacterized protein n=1 Tax=Calocera cornea HHB12733 TaxID=1353952 RepID=A0A165IAH8_9BASI|nr:hypothetical protein CALCODRAFT_492671 [Calocera cornea HHB12733]